MENSTTAGLFNLIGFHFRTPAEAEVKVLWAGLEAVCRWDEQLDTCDAPMAEMTQSQSGTLKLQWSYRDLPAQPTITYPLCHGSGTKVWPMKPVVMTLENLWQLWQIA